MSRESLNPVLSSKSAVLALLQTAKEKGATCKEMAAAGHLPVGTVSSALTSLAYSGEVGCLNLGSKPRRYALIQHGGMKWSPRQDDLGPSSTKSNGAAELRVVVSLGSDRKSLGYEEARALYKQLKPLFEKR